MANILIDHGLIDNIGDAAMLEAVVQRLRVNNATYRLAVIDRPGIREAVWDRLQVERVRCRIRNPLARAVLPPLKRRFFWRFVGSANRMCQLWSQGSLGRILPVAGLTVEDGTVPRQILEWCEEFDALHVVGGGNLSDFFPSAIWDRSCLIQAFAKLRKPIVLTGQQIGPFRSNISAGCIARALRSASFVGVREPNESLDFCRKANLSPEQFALMGDDSFGLKASEDTLVASTLARFGLERGQFLAANVRVAHYAADHGRHLEDIARLITGVANQLSLPVLVVPITFNEGESDVRAGWKLKEAIGTRARVTVFEETDLTPALAKGILGAAFGAVGVSYHFCTFALSQGVPAVCIFDGEYYGQKARGLCSFWNDSRLASNLLDATPDRDTEIVRTLLDKGLREHVHHRSVEVHEDWQRVFDAVTHSAFGLRTGVEVARV